MHMQIESIFVVVSQAIFKNLSGDQQSVDQNLKKRLMQLMLYRPPLQSACYFCSVLALLALLNLSCVYLLSRAPGVVELEEGEKKVYSGRIEPNMGIPARHVHAAPEYKQRKWMWGPSHVQEMLRVTLRLERAAEKLSTQ